MLRAVIQAGSLLFFLAAILFGSAGRIDYPMAWAFLCVYLAFIVMAFLLLDPELIRERGHVEAGVRRWDVVLASLSFVWLFPLTLLVAGLDAGRFGWSPPFPVTVQLYALGVFILGHALAFWAMVTNKFFSTFVRIQTERGHCVVSDGPYAYVRHPGYAGTILSSIALPISLGSLWALIPAFVGACLFVVRTFREDRTLSEELDGYREYSSRVRWRLIPGIW